MTGTAARPTLTRLPATARPWRGWIAQPGVAGFEWADVTRWIEDPTLNGIATQMVDQPDRRVGRWDTAQGRVYAKITLRRGEAHRGPAGWYDDVRFRVSQARAQRVLQVTARLEEAGFLVPAILCAAWVRKGVSTHNLIVSRAIPGPTLARTLIDARDQGSRPDIDHAIQRFATLAATMHQAGFVHGDFLPGNLIDSPDGTLALLDNDRTRFWPQALGGAPSFRRFRNLRQAANGIRLLVGYRAATQMLRDYDRIAGVDPPGHLARRRRIARHLRRRDQHCRPMQDLEAAWPADA